MKSPLSLIILVMLLAGCKKAGICGDGCHDQPATFYFIIADSKGVSLLSSVSEEIRLAYLENGRMVNPSDSYRPFKTTNAGATTEYILTDRLMASKSQMGTKTFYLTFLGKTDTLGLDIRQVKATPSNGGNSTPVVTFNGRPMQSVPGGASTPDYFVLKRR